MSKAMGLLPSWYWPEGVQRYVSAPPVPAYELTVGRWARRYGSDPAFFFDGRTTTYQEADDIAARVSAACRERAKGDSPSVAIALADPSAFALVLLGVLRAGGTALLLDPSLPAPELTAALDAFQGEIYVGESEPAGLPPGMQFLTFAGLTEVPAAPGMTVRPRPDAPAVALPGRKGLVFHSHTSLITAAMAFAAFTGLQPATRFVVARPPASWEALVGLLAPLEIGGAAVLARHGDGDSLTFALDEHDAQMVWMDEGMAIGLLESGGASADSIRRGCRSVYVSVQRPFPKRLRRHVRRLLRLPVLTVFGYAETFAIAASHDSWYLDEPVGIPMTSVDLLPVNPETMQPVEIPWEVLSYAGIGVSGNATAVEIQDGDDPPVMVEEGIVYTGELGSVDGNGMLYLMGG